MYFNVVKYLEKHSATPLGDTIFVRYIFDGDECWSFWNNIPDSGVKKIVARRNLGMDSFLLLRPKVSFFEFREPGFNIEKWISLNPRNIIDSNFFLLHNVIKTKSMCGTSIAIFPDRTLIRFLTDPHHELLYATPKEWYKILNTCKQNKNSN